MQRKPGRPVYAQENVPKRLIRDPERLLWQGKFGPAFWTIASMVSLTVNLILVVILVILGQQLFTLKGLIQNQLIGGLHTNFEKMDSAHILTNINVQDTIQVVDTIQVQDTMPVIFDLPLNQKTEVVLTNDTPVNNATIFMNNQAVPMNLVLRKGTVLGIRLNMTVPVSQTIPVNLTVPVNLAVPVNLNVPVDIALDQTDLHEPFVGLQGVVSPYQGMLTSLPNSWDETPICQTLLFNWFCSLILIP